MILDELSEKTVIRIVHQIVKPNARPDKDLFNALDRPHPAQQLPVFAMIHLQLGAGLGRQTPPVRTNPVFHLLVTGRIAEIGRGSAHIVYVALEIGQLNDFFRFFHHRSHTSGAHHPSLMKGQRTEVAGAETPSVMRDGEFHLIDCRHSAGFPIHRMPIPHIGQAVNLVQLLPLQRRHGRILHQHLPVVILGESLA